MSEKNQTTVHSNPNSQLISAIKKAAAKHLQAGLQNFFSSLDDSLFEISEKAESNEKRTQYMEAMRKLRMEKKNAAQSFFSTYEKAFNDCLAGENAYISSKEDTSSEEEFSFATLSLIEDDDLEESLAITNMIDKAHGLYREDLMAIGQRFNELTQDITLNSENNPLSPEHLCYAFEEAIEKLSIDLEIKLIVYKLFEKQVICNLAEMYADINNKFVSAGVLPTIKFKSPVKSKEQGASQAKVSPDSTEKPQNQETVKPVEVQADSASFDSLRQLLAQHRGDPPPASSAGQGSGASGAGAGGAGGSSGDGGSGENTEKVLSGLTNLQGSFSSPFVSDTDSLSVDELKAQLSETIRTIKNSVKGGGLGADDADAIDIVSMMFEFILEDKTLPDRFRAEIARMQIPIIKVSIIDKNFFAEKEHAARILLNELAYAGSTCEDDKLESDAVFKKVEYVVNTVIAEFKSNMEIFDQLLLEFKEFVATEMQANKKSGQKLSETKQRVSDEIARRLKNAKLPELISKLIVNHWKDVLTTIGMKQGRESPQWRIAMEVVDNLVWSVKPKLMTSEKQDLTRLIPKIVKNLKEGLTLIGLDKDTISTYLTELQQIHISCLKGTSEWSAETSDDDLESILNADIEKALSSVGKKNSFDTDFGDVEYFDSGNSDFSMIELPPKVKRSKQLQTVRNMQLSTWVEFYGKDKTKRGKLSWRCDFTGEYTFVDWRYRLVEDISIADLVTRLDEGTAAIVKDVPLLDKALNAVISTMSRYKNSSESQSPGQE